METGIADFKKRVTQADKIVIRDGTVKWDRPTDKDPVLRTITDSKEIAAFNKMFVFVEKAQKSDWQSKDEVTKWFSAHSIDLKTEKGAR